jgi:hypothetical protein
MRDQANTAAMPLGSDSPHPESPTRSFVAALTSIHLQKNNLVLSREHTSYQRTMSLSPQIKIIAVRIWREQSLLIA